MRKNLPSLGRIKVGALALLFLPTLLHAQQPMSGVVTGVQGQAQLTRSALAAPAPLRVQDGIVIRDVIDTREKSLARILFGGKAAVTVRELSRLEVREENLPGGGTRSTIELNSGAVLVNVARQLMGPRDEVHIRTPNAIAAVRGSAVYAEAADIFSQITGNSVLNCIAPLVCPTIALAENFTSRFVGNGFSPPSPLPPGAANQIVSSMQTGKSVTREGNALQIVAGAVAEATALQSAATALVGGQSTVAAPSQVISPPPPQTNPQSDCSGEGCGSRSAPPPTPPSLPPAGCGSAGNIIQNCSFEITGSIPSWNTSGAVTSITDMKDVAGSVVFKPTDGSRMALLHTGTGAVPDVVTGRDTSKLSQSTSVLQPGKVYLITFDYNFMSNEFPNQTESFNDIFEARAIGSGESILLAQESRNSSNFKTDKPEITTSGKSDAGVSDFTLDAGNGYTDWQTASKTVMPDENIGTLEFSIADVGDNNVPSGVLVDNVKVELDPPLYVVPNGQSLTGPSQRPLVEFADQSTTFDSVLVASGNGPTGAASVSLSGPLLKAVRSDLNVPYSLLGLLNGSKLDSSSTDPLVWLQGGNYSLSTLKGTAIFDFWGTKTALDPHTQVAVGSGPTVAHAGPLLQASDGAAVNTQKVLKLDTALLEATMPVIKLIGSANTHTSLTTESSAIDLLKGKLISIGPVIALDKGLINVNKGSLINLTSGSRLVTVGDLLSLTNGSKINVFNGPLISVSGAGSTLDVSGALVNFGGTGGNKIIVNNSITPTATPSGLAVSATSGAKINIGPNPVINPGLGTISVTGSLIQATNNGQVSIKAK